ncbi:MAG TPA: hypothetical protein VF816_05580 [Rhodocyclaceae bacterium]
MKARWQALEAKFAALQQREKIVVSAATVLGVVMLGYQFWVDPAASRASTLQAQLAKDKVAIVADQAEVARLTAQIKDRDAPNREALAKVKADLAEVDRQLQEYERVLLPPERVQEVLRSMLTRHKGLDLLSLQTLAPAPLVAESEPPADAKGAAPKTPPAGKSDSIHRQGIEIRIAGNYLDLLAYVAELEQLPQKMLWGNMTLRVTAYPTSELTLTVYTLSPDSRWLVV